MPKRDFKKALASLPVVGYFIRLVSDLVRLPIIYSDLIEQQKHTNNILSSTNDLVNSNSSSIKSIKRTSEDQWNEFRKSLAMLHVSQDDLRISIKYLEKNKKKNGNTPSKDNRADLVADDHSMDIFYTNFEDEFRGSEKDIKERLEIYLPYFKNSNVHFKDHPVLDIGSGRGEFLVLMKEHNINAVGVDINDDMVGRSNKKGLKTLNGNALEFLEESKSQSFGAITGFHIVEHIPFNSLVRLLKEALRTLTVGGFTILETPNPENIIVASSGFYTDPSHLNPIPPDLLAYALRSCGYKQVKIERLHPVDTTEEQTAGLPEEVAGRFYGPRDYAVIGYK